MKGELEDIIKQLHQILDRIEQIAGTQAPATKTTDPRLTPTESLVLEHLRLGMNNKEIGRALGLSWMTVKAHLRNISVKLGAHNRVQLAMWSQHEAPADKAKPKSRPARIIGKAGTDPTSATRTGNHSSAAAGTGSPGANEG